MGKKFSVTSTVYIDRPVEDVFAFACSFGNDPQWRTGVVELRPLQEGALRAGARLHEVILSYGQKVVTISEITRWEPCHIAEFRSLSGPIKVTGSRRLEAEGSGTRYTGHLEGDLNPFFSFLWPLMGGKFKKDFSRDLERLKAIIESSGD